MKSTLLLLLIVSISSLYLLTTAQLIDGQVEEKLWEAPAFVVSLQRLYRGPAIPAKKTPRDTVTTKWIEQKLDHFDEEETSTWQMRYMVNAEHYKPGGPIFILVGGEWDIDPFLIMSGHFYDMAKEHNAMLYYTEHRFYGESQPTSDLKAENLKYLNVQQALADLAHFVRYTRESDPNLTTAKVIMTGGFYSGSMVVWFKRFYPELLTGGWASSAPLLAMVDFDEFKVVAGKAILELGNKACYERIQNGIADLEEMFANKRGAEAKAMLKLCNSFEEYNDLDIWTLFSTISNAFSSVVQYQYEGDIPRLCDYLLRYDDDATAVSAFILQSYSSFGGQGCLSATYNTVMRFYKDITYEHIARSGYLWHFQVCNELGWYPSSSSRDQPFGSKFPVTLHHVMCADLFGDDYTPEQMEYKIQQTNLFFGGLEPGVENIYMTHGALDPWHPVGLSAEQGATIIPRTGHWQDSQSISNADSMEMRAAKERIAELIREWLST